MTTRNSHLAMLAILAYIAALPCMVASGADWTVDFGKQQGEFRALHGVNGGPLNHGGTVDVSKHWQALQIPITRLHDCEWPSGRVVDLHSLFPDLTKDATDARHYRFAETDDYLAATLKATPQVVFRLGESIEHTPRKYHVHPPQDFDAWAASCLGVIRHYNEGWADGFQHDIRYWEIWNEPENRPACWTGTDDDYYRLYATAAKAIKKEFPKLKVGGPAVGATGEFSGDQWQPTEFLQGFLKHCRDNDVPLDFFSWHTYSNDPSIYRRKAIAMRAWLDRADFKETELHLNEWNYLPDNDWSALSPTGQGKQRADWYARQAGTEAAAFVTYVLLDLQDSPVDVANYFHGDASSFGLFTIYGEPKKTYHAMRAFQSLLAMKSRVATSGGVAGESALGAGLDTGNDRATIVVSNYRSGESKQRIDVKRLRAETFTTCKIRHLNADYNLNHVVTLALKDNVIEFDLPAPGVAVIELSRSPE